MDEQSCPVCQDILSEINEMCLTDFASNSDVDWVTVSMIGTALDLMFTVSAMAHFMGVRRAEMVDFSEVDHSLSVTDEDLRCARKSYPNLKTARWAADQVAKIKHVPLPRRSE